jgi:HD superfamily phosphohydrolase
LKTPAHKRKIFNDPVHGFITIPYPLLFDIVEHPYFQRLRRIKQLGLSDYVYPGALHTRFHHALGAFHLMRKALSVLRLKGQIITEKEEIAACAAILLHDIGHGPFSHTLEHVLIPKLSHEHISKVYMQQLNKEFKGKLSLAIEVFEGSYPKKFLHQLVSSQLDTDRLDYISRDSFYTGVSEGTIAYDRIIEMMNVRNNELVVEQKGIYSVENFLIARRLMYWQVYLHKTVLSVEQMLIKAVERAKILIEKGEKLECSPPLQYFLAKDVTLKNFESGDALTFYSMLDDNDIMSALKRWQFAQDNVLKRLSIGILERKLFKIQLREKAFTKNEVNDAITHTSTKLGVSLAEAKSLIILQSTNNYAYNPAEKPIKILDKNDQLLDVAKAADLLNISVLSQPVVKHFLCYPK